MDGDDTVVNWDNVSSACSVHGHRGQDDESSNRSQPATKRSRSTQVSDEFVKRSVELSGGHHRDGCRRQPPDPASKA